MPVSSSARNTPISVNGKDAKEARSTAARIAVRRGEFVQLRRRLLGKTWVWYGLFIVVGSLLLVPGRPSRIPLLRPGEIASSDVVVDRDVVLPDAESTEEKRRRASFEVLPVYVYDPGTVEALTDKLDRSVKKHKEKSSDHHADDVIKARTS